MSANEEGPQNVESTESQDVSSGQTLAGGFAPSVGSVGGVKDSQLIKQLMSPVKASNTTPSGVSSEGEQVVRLPDPKNLHSYTNPSTPVSSWANSWAESTAPPNPAPYPRRPPPPSSFEPQTKRIKVEDRPSDKEDLKKLLLKWKKNKLDSVKENYNEHLAEMFFLENDGNIMDYQAWNKRPSREFLQYARQHKLEGDDSLESRFAHLNPHPLHSGSQLIKTENIQGNTTPQKSSNSSASKGMTSPGKPSKGLVVSGGSSVKQKTSSNDSGSTASQQDQMVEKAKQEAYVMQRIAALRKEGLWSEKRLAKVQEPPRPKAHWDYLLEEMVWLSADFAQERKWKKAAAKKCARMVQKYFQDKAVQAQKAEKEKEMRLRKIAAFAAKEIRTFWTNVEKLIEYKVNTQLDEKKKKALDQQLSFIVDQTEKYSSWLAESMNKPIDSTAVSTRSNTPSRESRMSDDEFEPAEASDDNEDTIAKEDDNPEEQESELKLLQKESEQTLEDLLNELPPGYFESRDLDTSGDSVSEKEEGEEETTKSEEEKDDNISKCDTQEEENQTESSLSCSNSSSVVSKRNRDRSKSETESCPVTDEVSKDEVEEEEEEEKEVGMDSGDTEFLADENEEDDEETILEQEEAEGAVDHEEELKDLQADNEIPIEELEKMYAEMAAAEMTPDETAEGNEDSDEGSDDGKEESEEDMEVDEGSEVEEEEEEEIASDEEEQQTDVGLETLMEDNLGTAKGDSEKADKELQDATAVAESLQPKGFTLSSTCVTTPVPFLLKHKLREYQHVGLDWLTTMYEKKLNGILADEMGLGKTIQTISVLAHLACEKGNWGPHLIVVPTSVMLNWEMECKKWCPAFKILTYYGTQKERKQKRQGWTKPNAFHICITSYKLVIQDHQSFRRKKWKYFILDEAQNIKNFKSQRWQLLLNFQSQRRLLLTGTPLQNNLMELWSLMHFLMPNVFASHREFREWFSNPVTGMIEGNKEYNDNIIKRLHKVLRPFILRRLKTEVEQQMPKKFEHIVMCKLSKRQRFLYEEFMSRAKTKETLASGNFLSVINVLMQLRKVCNHPNLFEARPTISPFIMEGISVLVPSLVLALTHYDPFKHVDLFSLNLMLADLEMCLTAFAAHRIRKFQASRKFIEEIDSAPAPPPKCPAGKIKLHVRPSSQSVPRPAVAPPPQPPKQPVTGGTVRLAAAQAPAATPGVAAAAPQTGGIKFQLIQQGGTIKAVPVPVGGHGGVVMQQTLQGPRLLVPQRPAGVPSGTGEVGTGAGGSGLKLVQTSTGQLLLTTASLHKPSLQTTSQGVSGTAAAALLQRLLALQGSVITTGAGGRPVLRLPTSMLRPQTHVSSSPEQAVNASVVAPPTAMPAAGTAQNVPAAGITQATLPASGAATLGVSAAGQTQLGIPAANARVMSAIQTPVTTPLVSPACSTPASPSPRPPTINTPPTQSPCKSTRSELKDIEKQEEKRKEEEWKRSVFFLSELEERRKKRRREKLAFINKLNSRRCHACPIYGMDLIEAVTITNNLRMCAWGSGPWNGQGYIQCLHATSMHTSQYMEQTSSLHNCTPTPETVLSNMKEIINNYVFCVPSVIAPPMKMRTHHPPPSMIVSEMRRDMVLKTECAPKVAPLHTIINSTVTQFPDPRLIQYDCGKLQVLDKLLRQLKQGAHRVLIFTQMTKMLDVFETFLNYHGHIYLRLDGTTRVDQRQVLMERFNQDKRIFVFILSTRSGGIGVNLTGADTVIFYDSDWNPTMDAQAQDRCHRIGQTRDVHIYRLISEQTVEENILKKANQKRMLGDLAIEGGNFTTAFFKKQTIQDLFDVDMCEQDAMRRMSEVLSKGKVEEGAEGGEGDKLKMGAFETALAAAEDETDVQAAKTAKAEAAAELAEFDENIPIEEGEGEEMSKAEQEVATLMKQLTPVERYAMIFLESADDGWAAEAERMEAEIEQQKKEWELGRLQALREEEERLAQNSEDDLLTFSSMDAHNQVIKQRGFQGKRGKAKGKRPVGRPPKRGRRRFMPIKVKEIEQMHANNEREDEEEDEEEEEEEEEEDEEEEEEERSSKKTDRVQFEEGEENGDNEIRTDDELEDDEETDEDSFSAGSSVEGLPNDLDDISKVKKKRNVSGTSITSKSSSDSNLAKCKSPFPPVLISKVSDDSPRTRSRGHVNINLWTLDVNPILPGERPMHMNKKYTGSLKEQDIPIDLIDGASSPNQMEDSEGMQAVKNGSVCDAESDDVDVIGDSSDSNLTEGCKGEVEGTKAITSLPVPLMVNNGTTTGGAAATAAAVHNGNGQ